MKSVALGLCLALLLPFSSAHASVERGGRQGIAAPLPREAADVASVEKATSKSADATHVEAFHAGRVTDCPPG